MLVGHPDRDRLKGIAIVIASASLFGFVDGISKILAETQSVGQIVVARYALALPVLLATTPFSTWSGLFRTARPRAQIGRAMMPLVISVSMVLAVRYLPLADATAILFAGPFLVVALSAPLLGEHVRPSSWIGVTVGFFAVLIVARPGFSEFSQFAIFPALAAVFFALFQLMTRRLANAGENPNTTLAWTLATGTIVALPLAIATWVPTDTRAWLLMIALGLVFGVAQSLLARAFVHAPANVLTPFSYVQIVAAIAFGYAVFGAVPDVWTIVGVAMIIGAGAYVAHGQSGRRGGLPEAAE